MKKRNFLSVGVAVLLSGVLIIATSLTGNAAGNAYEQLKLLMREDHARPDNMTLTMNIDVTDNGTSVLHGEGIVKTDTAEKCMSGSIQISGMGDQGFEFYGDEDSVLLKLAGSENWYKAEPTEDRADEDDEDYDRFGGNREHDNYELREMVMDTLMGDLKDQVVLEQANGLRTFSLTLDEGNMPVLLQTLFSAGSRDREICDGDEYCDLDALPQELLDFAQELKVYRDVIDFSGDRTLNGIKLTLTVDNQNQPVAMSFTTNFRVTNDNGGSHQYQIYVSMAISDVNTTVVDTVSPDPASIIEVDTSSFEKANHRFRR